jgi:hypothetical protein
MGCASTYKPSNYDIDSNYRYGNYDLLISQIQEKIKESPTKDKILWELNLALAYQAQGNYQESNNILIKVKEKIRWQDFLNIKDETLAFLLNDKYKEFNLVEYEQFLIQVYVAMNFALMGKWQSALVEMRNADYALYNLKQSNINFTHVDKVHLSYLSGVIYEANGKFDEAFIDYERVLNSKPDLAYLKYDLYRTAYLSNRKSKAEEYKRKFSIPHHYVEFIEKGLFRQKGELIVVFQNGMAPYKAESKRWANLPELQPRVSNSEKADVVINYEDWGNTVLLMDFEKLALELYEAQYKTMLAKDVARSVLKEAAAWTVAAGSGFVSVVVARQIAHSSSNPDLRSWFLLPKEIQIARMRLSPGEHRLQLNYNYELGEVENKDIKIQPNRILMVPFRFGNNL